MSILPHQRQDRMAMLGLRLPPAWVNAPRLDPDPPPVVPDDNPPASPLPTSKRRGYRFPKLTEKQKRLLAILDGRELSTMELQRELGASRSTAIGALTRLEERGLVASEYGERDGKHGRPPRIWWRTEA